MRCGNCCTNHGESSRMYPARQIKSTSCCLRAATTSRSCCSRSFPLEGIARAVSPSLRAVSKPPASVLLEMTIAMRALGIAPAVTFRAIASKFEPRPERRMPMFLMGCPAWVMGVHNYYSPLTAISPMDANAPCRQHNLKSRELDFAPGTVYAPQRVVANSQHIPKGMDAVANGMQPRARAVRPAHRHFHNFEAQPLRYINNFWIEPPAFNLLRRKNCLCGPPGKRLEAALRVLELQSQYQPQRQIKNTAQRPPVNGLFARQQGRIQPA